MPVFNNRIAGVAFQPGDEPEPPAVETIKPGIVDISPIHDEKITPIKRHFFGGGEIVFLAIRKDEALRLHVHQNGMKLHGAFLVQEWRLGENAGAQVNGGGVNNLDFRVHLSLFVHFRIYSG